MSFVKYQNTNNASSLLIADITASQTTILITDGDQSLFPSSFPFLLTLEHLDANENVILREIVKVVSGNQNSFTVERSAGICVQDDTATNRVQDNTAHAFYSGDKISLYWTAEQVADIQNNLELKANQDSIANVYDSTATYAVGDIVVYNGDRYICQTAVSTPEDFDSSKWTKVNIQYNLDDQQNQIDNIEAQISQLGGLIKVDVMLVGGGGGGGRGCGSYGYGGGGGAGAVEIVYGLPLTKKSISVSIGNGGTGGTAGQGTNGGLSKFGVLTALGGGGGGGGRKSGACLGKDGGNGGGAGGLCSGMTPIGGGLGLQGFPGGYACCGRAGGGGGAGGLYTQSLTLHCTDLGLGGIGIATCFGGTLRKLGGGGTGYHYSTFCNMCNVSGLGYGGGDTQGSNGCPGGTNTGGGGGGGGDNYNGGAGGSGLVIVRYPKDCSYGIACATGGTITTPTINGVQYVVHTFTSGGTFQITQTA